LTSTEKVKILNRGKCTSTEESEGLQYQETKESLKKVYTRKLRIILKCELNAKKKITAVGLLAFTVL
jgi:hypothetical protein